MSTLSWTSDHGSILLGREDGVVKVFSLDSHAFIQEAQTEASKVVGICDHQK